MFTVLLIILLSLIGLVGVLLYLVKRPRINVSAFSKLSIGTWWVKPVVLWILLWAIIWFYLHPVFTSLWAMPLLFWSIQGLNAMLIWGGRNLRNRLGNLEKPAYPQILAFIVGCMVVVAIVVNKYFPDVLIAHAKARQTIASINAPAAMATETSTPVPAKPVQQKAVASSSLPIFEDTIDVLPRDSRQITVHTVPVGYTVTKIEGEEKVTFIRTRLSNAELEFKFRAKGDQAVQITVRCEPEK